LARRSQFRGNKRGPRPKTGRPSTAPVSGAWEPIQVIARAFARVRTPPLSRGISVTEHSTPLGTETHVHVRDRLPRGWLHFGPATIVIETGGHRLPANLFTGSHRDAVQRTRNKKKGRVLYAMDVELAVPIAAVAFHVDDHRGVPFVVTAAALRSDSPEAHALSAGLARCLLSYLAEASFSNSRSRSVGLTLEPTEDDSPYTLIGFAPATKPPELAGGGARYYLLRPPLVPK
jgi:hypothetical protein